MTIQTRRRWVGGLSSRFGREDLDDAIQPRTRVIGIDRQIAKSAGAAVTTVTRTRLRHFAPRGIGLASADF